MSKIVQFLPAAPFLALIISIAYLQGYWGHFDILIFPYLSLSELISYATAPLFGVFASLIIGTLIAYANNSDTKVKQSRLRTILEALLFASCTLVLFYFDFPSKWLGISILSVAISLRLLRKIDVFMRLAKLYPGRYFILVAYLLLVASSFGYGRSSAATLVQMQMPNVIALVDGQLLPTKLIGKIDNYFFFLHQGKVVQYSADSIKSIAYQKQFH